MAAHMIRFRSDAGMVHWYCTDCGSTGFRLTAESARASADRHRETRHPRQASFVASKRRTRNDVVT
jgi:hypothetical protein